MSSGTSHPTLEMPHMLFGPTLPWGRFQGSPETKWH